ncbi:hypothetical protein D3C83_84110 [compost metagenome]
MSTCPPSIAVMAFDAESNTTVRTFLTSTPADFSTSPAAMWLAPPATDEKDRLSEEGSLRRRSTRSRPSLIGESAFTANATYSSNRMHTGVKSR